MQESLMNVSGTYHPKRFLKIIYHKTLSTRGCGAATVHFEDQSLFGKALDKLGEEIIKPFTKMFPMNEL